MKPWIIGGLLIACFVILAVACKYDEVVLVQPDRVSFSEDILPIFEASCSKSGCHNGTISPDLTPAHAYSSLFEATLIDTLNPTGSELYLWMSGAKGLPMPPEGVNPIYVANILQWIDEGALNN